MLMSTITDSQGSEVKRKVEQEYTDEPSPTKRQKSEPHVAIPEKEDSSSNQTSSELGCEISHKRRNADTSATPHGGLILYLISTCPLVTPRDLIPLRAVSKSYRDDIDRQLFRHLRVKTEAKQIIVLDAAKRKLPGFMPRATFAQYTIALARLKHTGCLDIQKAHKKHLAFLSNYLPNVHTIRLPSNDYGRHTYQPPVIGKARTMIVFPSLLPSIDTTNLKPRIVPPGITKLVQHLTCHADTPYSRGSVLFRNPGIDVTKEVWVFTHYKPKVMWSCLGLYDDRVHDWSDDQHEELCRVTIARLETGMADLTLVDDDPGLANIWDAYRLYMTSAEGKFPSGYGLGNCEPNAPGVQEVLRDCLAEEGAKSFSRLHVKTWDEYAAALTENEVAMEALPDGVSRKLAAEN